MAEDNQFNSVDVVEEWITRSDGVEIYTKRWKSVVSPPIATVVFLHGFGEHVSRYNHVFDKFALKGVEVLGYDQRGYGKTAARYNNRGQSGGWKVIVEDITAFLVSNRRSGIPQFLFGHSMGGCLTTMYAADGPERNNLAGVVLSSPLIEPAPQSRMPNPIITLCTIVSKVMPNVSVPINLDVKFISRNPTEVEKYEKDPLNHNLGCLIGLTDLINGIRLVSKEKYKQITLPIYICFGTADKINDCDSARELFSKLPSQNKTWREWPGCYHELHHEDVRDAVIEDYLNWILKEASQHK